MIEITDPVVTNDAQGRIQGVNSANSLGPTTGTTTTTSSTTTTSTTTTTATPLVLVTSPRTKPPQVKLTTVKSLTTRKPPIIIVAAHKRPTTLVTPNVTTELPIVSNKTTAPVKSQSNIGKVTSLAVESTTVSPVITNSTILPVSTSSPFKPEVNPINTKISLYTRKNPLVGHLLNLGDGSESIASSPLDPNTITRVIIHGSFDGVDYGHWMRDMKTRLLEVEDSNVIIVDWSATASLALPAARVSNARVIGHQVAKILEDLHVS